MEAFVQTNIRFWQMLCCLIAAITVALGAGVCFVDERNRDICSSDPVFSSYAWSSYRGLRGQYFVLLSSVAFLFVSSLLLVVHIGGKWIDQKLVVLICFFAAIIMLTCGILEMNFARNFLKDQHNVELFVNYYLSSVTTTMAFCYLSVVFYTVDGVSALKSAIREYEWRRESLKRKSNNSVNHNQVQRRNNGRAASEVHFASDVVEKIIEA